MEWSRLRSRLARRLAPRLYARTGEEGTTNYITYSDASNLSDATLGAASVTKASFTVGGAPHAGLTWVQGSTADDLQFSLSTGTPPVTSGLTPTLSYLYRCTRTGVTGKGKITAVVGGTTYFLANDLLSWTTSVIEAVFVGSGYTATNAWVRLTLTMPPLPAGTLTAFSVQFLHRNVATFTANLADFQLEFRGSATALVPTSGAIATRQNQSIAGNGKGYTMADRLEFFP